MWLWEKDVLYNVVTVAPKSLALQCQHYYRIFSVRRLVEYISIGWFFPLSFPLKCMYIQSEKLLVYVWLLNYTAWKFVTLKRSGCYTTKQIIRHSSEHNTWTMSWIEGPFTPNHVTAWVHESLKNLFTTIWIRSKPRDHNRRQHQPWY